jgi:uncharacterized protein
LRFLFRKNLLLGVVFAAAVSILVLWLAGSYLCAPANRQVGDLPPDLNGRAVQFTSESGAIIRGWFIPGKKGAGAVVLMHGVRGSRLDMLDRARFLSGSGYSILLFDFQAHGESTGQHITFGNLESKDAQAAVGFLRTVAVGERLGVIGVSLGGAATLLSSPPLNVDAMVLEMVYPTFDQAVGDRLAIRLGAWSKALTPLLTWQLKPRLGISPQDLRPIDRVGQIKTPKLFIAGGEDLHTTIEESRQLFAAASEPKELWIVNGAKHQDAHAFAREEYERRVLEFFSRNLRG